MTETRDENLDELAAAYVLGTLSSAEREKVATQIRHDPQLEQMVQQWERRLLPLVNTIPVVSPPPKVWERIAEDIQPKTPCVTNRPWWQPYWPTGAALAFGLLLGVASTLFFNREAGVPESYVGFLSETATTKPALHASAKRKEKLLFVKTISPVKVPSGKQLILWALPENAAPRRLGTVPAEGKGQIKLETTADEMFKDVPSLAVSMERLDDNRDSPSGKLILRGPCVKLW